MVFVISRKTTKRTLPEYYANVNSGLIMHKLYSANIVISAISGGLL